MIPPVRLQRPDQGGFAHDARHGVVARYPRSSKLASDDSVKSMGSGRLGSGCGVEGPFLSVINQTTTRRDRKKE